MLIFLSFLLQIILILIIKSPLILIITLVIVFINTLVLSNFKLKKFKKLRFLILTYLILAIINYLFNQNGLVYSFFGINIYIDTLKHVSIMFLKLTAISLSVMNIASLRRREVLLYSLNKTFAFLKIFKININKISVKVLLMLIFLDEIISTLKNAENNSNNKPHASGVIDKMLFRIKTALNNCEKYYFEKLPDIKKKINGLQFKEKPIDIIFFVLYIFLFTGFLLKTCF